MPVSHLIDHWFRLRAAKVELFLKADILFLGRCPNRIPLVTDCFLENSFVVLKRSINAKRGHAVVVLPAIRFGEVGTRAH